MVPFAATALPFTLTGLNFDLRAAASAEARKSGCPFTALAAMTLPSVSIVTATATLPAARAFLASEG